MRSLQVTKDDKTVSHICAHWKTFPPLASQAEDPVKLRDEKTISDAEYNQLQIWKRICGLQEMTPEKCLTCPHVRRVEWHTRGPVLIDLMGVVTPVTDMSHGEASPRHRHMINLFRQSGPPKHQNQAAWVEVANRTDTDNG